MFLLGEAALSPKRLQVQMRPWEPGDVLGFALDYNGGKMHLSHQGTWYPEKEAPGLNPKP